MEIKIKHVPSDRHPYKAYDKDGVLLYEGSNEQWVKQRAEEESENDWYLEKKGKRKKNALNDRQQRAIMYKLKNSNSRWCIYKNDIEIATVSGFTNMQEYIMNKTKGERDSIMRVWEYTTDTAKYGEYTARIKK